MLLDELLRRRLILLTGKGGVGKSVVGAALAVAAAGRGQRALLLEVDAPLDAARYLDAAGGPGEREVLPGVFTVNLRPAEVMEEYIRRTVRVEMLVRRIVLSPVYQRFFAAAPGLKELMVLGKILALAEERDGWSRRRRYDVVIADLPATGHGLSLLRVPLRASAAIPVGPVGSQARRILSTIRDPDRTALAVVAIPEEMAVSEAIEFQRAAADEVGVAPAALILNACHERRFSRAQEAEILRLSGQAGEGRLGQGVALGPALAVARRHLRRSKRTRFYEARLRRLLPTPLVRLPFLYEERLGLAGVRRLAQALGGE